MQSVEEIEDLACLCEMRHLLQERLYNPVDGLFHVEENIVRIEMIHLFISLLMALHIPLCKDHRFNI